MAARHRARATSIQILKVEIVISSKCRRPQIKQMHVSKTTENILLKSNDELNFFMYKAFF